MMNPVRSHLDSLVKVEAGEMIPYFCLLTQDLPPMSLERARVVGSASPPITSVPIAQSGTRQLPGATQASSPDPAGLQEIQEGILQHNLECQDVQTQLSSKRQRLHLEAVKYGLSTNLWTAIILMLPIRLLEASHINGFTVYDCSPEQLKTQTIDLTAPKDCKDPKTNYYPVKNTEIRRSGWLSV
jgi:hypothetical protein